MKKVNGDHGAYVRKVREETQRYAQDVLADNEKLRVLVASMESEKLRLQDQVLSAQQELARYQQEQDRLREQLRQIEDESRRFSARYADVEEENSNLANLYVASYRLHGTVERREVLTVIQEVVANLIGSEEMAVYELNPEGSALSLVGSFGIEPERHRTVPAGAGLIGGTVLSGETYVGDGDRPPGGLPQETDLTACIPLKLDGRVTGAIALFRLLPQKAGFQAVDRELFDLLATHAATALYCSALHARLTARVGMPA
jgi:GAF domain-containing protein